MELSSSVYCQASGTSSSISMYSKSRIFLESFEGRELGQEIDIGIGRGSGDVSEGSGSIAEGKILRALSPREGWEVPKQESRDV